MQALILLILLTVLPALARPAHGKRCRPRSSTTVTSSSAAVGTSAASVVVVTTSAQPEVITNSSEAPVPTSAAAPANVAPAPSSNIGSGSSNSGSSNSGSSNSNSNSNSGSSPTLDESAYLDPQNAARAQYGASPLTWNDTLASAAQEWANKCVFQHSLGALGPFGENLAAGSGDFSVASGIQLWLDEASQYDPSNPVPSHWTQVVWKGSNEVGCAVAVCPGLLGASFGNANFYVCEYFPEGNVIGAFAQNVQ